MKQMATKNIHFQQIVGATIQDLQTLIGQLVTTINLLQQQGSSNIPAQPIINTKGMRCYNLEEWQKQEDQIPHLHHNQNELLKKSLHKYYIQQTHQNHHRYNQKNQDQSHKKQKNHKVNLCKDFSSINCQPSFAFHHPATFLGAETIT